MDVRNDISVAKRSRRDRDCSGLEGWCGYVHLVVSAVRREPVMMPYH